MDYYIIQLSCALLFCTALTSEILQNSEEYMFSLCFLFVCLGDYKPKPIGRGVQRKLPYELDNGLVPLPAKLCYVCKRYLESHLYK